MMRVQFWRFLLTLSLLLTLPMQGYAAARMASCDAVLAGALAQGGGAGFAHHMPHGMAHDMQQADMQSVGMHNISMHSGTHDGVPDGAQGTSHTAHGTSCMGCTPCSPGATLTRVVPVSSAFFSARVVPAVSIAPASVDLAHPERPPQVFLA
jgi:hypothetical protein